MTDRRRLVTLPSGRLWSPDAFAVLLASWDARAPRRTVVVRLSERLLPVVPR